MTDPAAAYAASAHYELLPGAHGPVVVLLHGLGGTGAQPLGLLPGGFAGCGYPVLAPDARAHGATRHIGDAADFTLDQLAADVLALVDALGLGGRPLLPVGISMGAAVGLRLIQVRPDLVARALLIRPSFSDAPWPAHLRVFRLIARLLREQGPAGRAAFQRSSELGAVAAVSQVGADSLVGQFDLPEARERVVRLEQVPANPALTWPGVWDPGIPVTVVGAEGDPNHPLWVARRWHESMRGSSLAVVPSRDADPFGYAEGLAGAVRAVLRP